MGDYVDVYLDFFTEFNKSVDKTDQLPVKIIAGNLRDHDIIGCVIDWTQQYLAARQCPSSLIAQICKYVVTEMQVYRAVDPGGCGYQKDSNVWNPLKLMQATIKKVIDVCQRHKDRNSVSKLTPPRDNMCLTILSTNKNARRTMEDKYTIIDDLHEMLNIEGYGPASFYGVLDGHGGAEAAMYGASRLFQCLAESPLYPAQPGPALVHAFKQCDAQYVEKAKAENLQSGTTAVVALLLQDLRKLYVAWIGDTQAVLSRREGEVTQLVFPSHRPNLDSEKERIEEMGGCVLYFNGQCRVQGTLAVSRAIGDKDFKPYVCADPEVLSLDLDGTEDFLLLATDGLWEEVTEVEVAEAVYGHLVQYGDQHLKRITDSLIQLAKARGSKDNVTCLLVFLRPPLEVPAASARPRLRAMQSPPPLASPAPRYNGGAGAYLGEEDFGPETDVDGGDVRQRRLHEPDEKTPGGNEHHALELSSDSEGEGEEGGGWDFVQTPAAKPPLHLSGPRHAAPADTNSSDSEADDMNHALNPDAAEFVPVHSPDHTTRKRPQDEFIGNNGHAGHEVDFAKTADFENHHKFDLEINHKNELENNHGFDVGNNKIDLENNHKFDLEINHKADLGHNLDDVINGKHDVETRLGVADDVILACSPGKPNHLQRLEDEKDFLSDIQKRPSSGLENGDHGDELNGFQSLDSSHTHATLGDTTYLSDLMSPAAPHAGSGNVTTSSLSPSSPELNPGATTNPFDLHTGSNAFETSGNASMDFEETRPGDDFEFKASSFEPNGFSNDFTGTNEEVSRTLVDAGFPGDETQLDNPGAAGEADFTTVGKSPLDGGFGDPDTHLSDPLQESLAADSSPASPRAEGPGFDSRTFNEFHTANDASAMFEKTSETSAFFGREPAHTDALLSSHPLASGAEETITSMLDLVDTPPSQERRVSSEVMEAYHAVVHSLDSPPAEAGFDSKPNMDAEFGSDAKVKEEFGFEATKSNREDPFGFKSKQNAADEFGFDSKPNAADEFGLDSKPNPADEFGLDSKPNPADEFGLDSKPNPADEFGYESKQTVEHEFGVTSQAKQEPLDNFEEGTTFEDLDPHSFNGERGEEESSEVVNQDSFNAPSDPSQGLDKEHDVGNGSHVDVKREAPDDSGEAELHRTVTDEFEFHQEANGHATDRVDRMEQSEAETQAQTVHVGAISGADFMQKHSGGSYDEIHEIHRDEAYREVRLDAGDTQDKYEDGNVIREEDEEEIQIGKKVSDLNETDIMSRSFYGDYGSHEAARSPSPEEMIDHYASRTEGTLEAGLGERTPTRDGTSLEAKLAEEDSQAVADTEAGHFVHHAENSEGQCQQAHLVEETVVEEESFVEDKPEEEVAENTPKQGVVEDSRAEEKQGSHLFDISQEEASFTEKTSQVYDDLTFNSSAVLETNLDDVALQEAKPQEDTKVAALSEDILSAPTIPDVIPTQGDDSQATPAVDLTQDIVEETKVPPVEEASKPSESVAEPGEAKETSDVATTVAAAAAVAAGTVAAAAVVKKATAKKPAAASAPKKPDAKSVTKTTAKPLAKPAAPKPSPKPATAAPAKPAVKPAAAKPLAAAKAAAAAKPTAARKPLASSAASKSSVSSVAASKTSLSSVAASKSSVSSVAAGKSSVSSVAAAKPRAPASAPAKPLTNGVTKRPASATTTAAPASKAPAAPRVPLSMRTSKPAPGATPAATPKPSAPPKPSTTAPKSTTKLSTTTTKPSTTKPSAPKLSTTAAASKPGTGAAKPGVAAKTSLAARSSVSTKPPPPVSAAAAAVAAARKSPATRRPLAARGKNSSSSPAIPKTEPRSEADAVIRKPTPVTTPPEESAPPTAPVELMTNGH